MGKKIIWTDRAKVSLRAIDQPTALRILHALAMLLATGEGDVKQLQNIDPPQFRLRVGDYRARFYNFDQWLAAPIGGLVNRVYDEFFAGAGLSRNQRGLGLARDAIHHAHELVHQHTGNDEQRAIDVALHNHRSAGPYRWSLSILCAR